jgi:hypothetical protein
MRMQCGKFCSCRCFTPGQLPSADIPPRLGPVIHHSATRKLPGRTQERRLGGGLSNIHCGYVGGMDMQLGVPTGGPHTVGEILLTFLDPLILTTHATLSHSPVLRRHRSLENRRSTQLLFLSTRPLKLQMDTSLVSTSAAGSLLDVLQTSAYLTRK